MLDTGLKVKAMDTYIRTGNMSLTLRILKEAGYIISRATLDRWKNESQDTENDWKNLRRKHLKEMAVQQATLESLKDKILTEMIADRDSFRSDLVGKKKTSQDAIALNNMSKELLKVISEKDGHNQETDKRVKKVIDLFFDDPVIGKRLEGLEDYIAKKVDEMMGKK